MTPPKEDSLFDVLFIQSFMPAVTAIKAAHTPQANGENSKPDNVAAFLGVVGKLDRADPLSCKAYYDMLPLLSFDDRILMSKSIQRKHFAFDHVEVVASVGKSYEQPTVVSMYLARGRPDKWQPWTKQNHRRRVEPGVWVCKKGRGGNMTLPEAYPEQRWNNAFWANRREVGIVGVLRNPAQLQNPNPLSCDLHMYICAHLQFVSPCVWQVGLVESLDPADVDKAQVYFYNCADELSNEGSHDVYIDEIEVLNVHLGKAGGLNFGLAALMNTPGVIHPSVTHPLMFGIIDARHSCDGRFWCDVLPAFYLLTGDSDEHVTFDPDICLCQLPHNYIGTKFETDKLDMRNDFLFSGMGIARDRCYGMTSCGTGGIWAITTPLGTDSYFFGRTMIEDTSTTHMKFFEGKCSVYLPPKRGGDPLMRAVPKVSANYLEALERWDTGAVQIFLSLSVPSLRFWIVLAYMLLLTASTLLPAMTGTSLQDIAYYCGDLVRGDTVNIAIKNDVMPRLKFDLIMILISATTWFITFVTPFILSITSPRMLNYLLRYLIIFFNSMYPFNSVTTIFWLSLPPWMCFSANFPFHLQVLPATVGSLVLRAVEFAMVGKMKKDAEEQGAYLQETSIYRSQQLDLVTVPIKLRAIAKGFQTGYRDIFNYEDNSWWESFGGGHAKNAVQTWLIVVCTVMALGMIVGPIQLIVMHFRNQLDPTNVFAVLFGMAMSAINLWVLWSPTWYLLKDKGDRPGFSLRYVNVGVILIITIAVLAIDRTWLSANTFVQNI